MKITNLIALPFGLIADAISMGEAGVTRRIFNDERNQREIEALQLLVELSKQNKDS